MWNGTKFSDGTVEERRVHATTRACCDETTAEVGCVVVHNNNNTEPLSSCTTDDYSKLTTEPAICESCYLVAEVNSCTHSGA